MLWGARRHVAQGFLHLHPLRSLMGTHEPLARGTLVLLAGVGWSLLASASPALAHGAIPQGSTHDTPTLFDLLITPVAIALLHLGAMLALIYLAASARRAAEGQSAAATRDAKKGAAKALGQREGLDPLALKLIPTKHHKELRVALRPNRNMYIASDSLPYFFVLTGLAAFLSIFTYPYLGERSVYVYTLVHSIAIVLLFLLARRGWGLTAFAASPTRVLVREGAVADRSLVVKMDKEGLVVVRQNALQRMAKVGSLHFYADASFKDEFPDASWNDVDDPSVVARSVSVVLGLKTHPEDEQADDSEE